MFDNYPDVMTVDEARTALHIGKSSMYSLIKSGEIKSFTCGRNIRIPKTSLVDFLADMCDNKVRHADAV